MTAPNESLPMYFPPAPFDLQDAVMCSALVNAAYDMYQQWVNQDSPSDPSQFTWTPNGPSNLNYSTPMWGVAATIFPEPFAFLAWDANSGQTYLAFRGSETYADFYEDADVNQVTYDPVVPGFGYVHEGFMNVYTNTYTGFDFSTGSEYTVPSLSSTIINALDNLHYSPTVLRITGHSLGAGLSTLCVPDVARNSNFKSGKVPMFHYSLASPRVGAPNFAYNYNFQVPVKTYRIVNTEDIVPYGPPPVLLDVLYEHVGTTVDFTAQYGSTDGNHSYRNSYFYALNNPNQPQGPIVSSGQYAKLRMAEARRRHDLLKGKSEL